MVNTTYKTQLPRLAEPITNNGDAAQFAKTLKSGGHAAYGVTAIGQTFIVTCYCQQTALNISNLFRSPSLGKFYVSCVPYESREDVKQPNGHVDSYPCVRVAIKVRK